MAEPFGFKVRRTPAGKYDEEAPEYWEVELPHRCEEWQIAGPGWNVPGHEEEDKCWYPTREEAGVELTRFIAEANLALHAIQAGHEFGVDDGS